MNVADLLTAFSDHGFDDSTASTQRKTDVINDVIYDICTREAWPFLETTTDIVGAGSGGALTLPADFGNTLDLYDVTTGQKMAYWRYDDFMDAYAQSLTQTGDPYIYFFVGNGLFVYPLGTSHTFRLRYIRRPAKLISTDLEAAIAIPKYWHSIILYGGLAQLYDMTDDPDPASRMDERFERKYQLMREAVWKRQYDLPEFIHFVDEFQRGYR